MTRETAVPVEAEVADCNLKRRRQPGDRRASVEWLPAELEHLRVVRMIDRPLRAVETSLRVRPDKLIQRAYGYTPGGTEGVVSFSPWDSLGWLRMPVRVESWTPAVEHPAAVIAIRWQGSRLTRYFPVMEANLELRSREPDQTELVLDGRYRPPLGLIGLIGDRLFAKWLASATARSFVDRLADSIEEE